MKTIKNIILFIPVVLMGSCNLNVLPDNIATIDNAFTLRNEAEKYLFTCYSYMPYHASVTNNPCFFGCDELVPGTYYSEYTGYGTLYPYFVFTGRQGLTTTYMNFWDGYNGGSLSSTQGNSAYAAIYNCNIFLDNIPKVPDMSESERQRWIGEVKFLKAYYHYWLVKQYGPVIIRDVNLPVDVGIEEAQSYRNTLDECFEYIVGLLDEVIDNEFVPDRIENEAEELGRITRAIALAVKADVLITAASPLFNGNTYYKGLTDNRGIEIFNPNKTEEEKIQRWRDARDACKAAIDFAHSVGMQLYHYESLEYPGISDETRAKLTIRMSITDKWNSEIVWGDSNNWVGSGTRSLDIQALPRDLDKEKISNTTSRNNHAVPLKIAEQFYTKNGVPIDEDKTWDYENRYTLRTATADEKFLIKEGYTTAAVNFDREIRYYADLGFDGGIWFGQGKTDDANCYYVQAKFGENCGNTVYHSWNKTGIWPKKMVHMKTVVGTTSGVTTVSYPFPIMRLANLYLFYAEAMNETGEHTTAEILEYVDLVRARAGLKGVEESWTNFSTNPTKFASQSGLREIIQQERLIEFAFEGQRYWDLRRWMRMHIEMPKPQAGWSVAERETVDYYVPELIYTPSFRIRDYFTPIGEQEMRRNTNLVQNYGW